MLLLSLLLLLLYCTFLKSYNHHFESSNLPYSERKKMASLERLISESLSPVAETRRNGEFCLVFAATAGTIESSRHWRDWFENHDELELLLEGMPTDQQQPNAAPVQLVGGW